MNEIIKVSGNTIRTTKINGETYISLTDIAKERNSQEERFVIQNWMRNKTTIKFLGLWEELNNPNFNRVNFDTVKNEAGENAFTMTPKKWIETVNAIGITSKAGRYNSGTFAHQDIALEFASWISPEFKLYIIKEFQRLKEIEQRRLEPEWTVNRILSKVNYKIHTDAIKENLIEGKNKRQIPLTYANEADMINQALFGKTNKLWREETGITDKKKNIREYATIEELLVLSNIEFLNSKLIEQGLDINKRFSILQQEVDKQLNNLIKNKSVKLLKDKNYK